MQRALGAGEVDQAVGLGEPAATSLLMATPQGRPTSSPASLPMKGLSGCSKAATSAVSAP
jgi:hypothetical protein